MALRRSAEMNATSRTDELAFRALAEIIAITSDQDARIIGGHMVALLMAAFPVPDVAARRTRDADTAITNELAGSGVLHDRLLARGWSSTSGNNYIRRADGLAPSGKPAPEMSVDLLVPSYDGQFRPALHGDRAFDSAPGLDLALAAEPIEIAARVRLLNGTTMEFTARVPTVEIALIIKSYAYRLRLLDRDVEDIYRLLEIVDAYPAEAIGGWRLDQPGVRGYRGDAKVLLNQLAGRARQLRTADIPHGRLAVLIAGHVHSPEG